MRDWCMKTSTSVEIGKEGRDNPTILNRQRHSHTVCTSPKKQGKRPSFSVESMRSHTSNGRYSYSSYGSRVSVELKVVPNADLPANDHFRSMSARASDSVRRMQTLHVPTRRENFNSNCSVTLGHESAASPMTRTLHSAHSRKDYVPKTRYASKPPDTLSVHDLKSSQALNDLNPGTTNRDFNEKQLASPNANQSQRKQYQAAREDHYIDHFKMGHDRSTSRLSDMSSPTKTNPETLLMANKYLNKQAALDHKQPEGPKSVNLQLQW